MSDLMEKEEISDSADALACLVRGCWLPSNSGAILKAAGNKLKSQGRELDGEVLILAGVMRDFPSLALEFRLALGSESDLQKNNAYHVEIRKIGE